jgi:hypothetical protein
MIVFPESKYEILGEELNVLMMATTPLKLGKVFNYLKNLSEKR